MTTATTARFVIKVTNNNDDGEGSLREAIRQGNQAVQEGKAVEIAFTSSLHIKVKTGYHLEKGDWTFNKQLTKNIIIDGESASGPLFQIGNQNNIDSSVNAGQVEDLKVDVTRMHLINSHVKGGDGKKGGGGGLGAGSALLHFNGHVTWRESSFQGNTVEGGKGAEGARGGQSFYIHNSNKIQQATSGEKGDHGGGFNSSSKTSQSNSNRPWIRNGKAGNKGFMNPSYKNDPSRIIGGKGGHGHDGKLFGEAGGGGGGGGGGHKNSVYAWGNETEPGYDGDSKRWGSGGRGGNGGNGNFGAGGGVGGSAGANAGNNRFWLNKWPFWYEYRNSPSWTYKNKQGASGRSGEWASAPTKASDPTRTEGGKPGRGGDGAALGIISSFAKDNEKSSFTFDNVDFRKNTAKGGAQTGRFSNIYSRYINIQYNDVTNSTGDSHRGGVIGDNNFKRNTNSATTDKSKIYANSGRFSKLEPTEGFAPQEIWSSSYEIDSSVVQTFGKVHQLGNSNGHTIVLHADHSDSGIQQIEIKGAQSLLKAVRELNNFANRTKSEEEIRSTHKGVLGSLTASPSFKQAKKLATGKITKKVDEYATKFDVGSYAKFAKGALGVGAIVYDTIFNQMAEDARIEKELKEKRLIDKRRGQINQLVPTDLKVQPFDTTSKRTYDTFKDFTIGRDQLNFTPQIAPTVTYRWDPAKGVILNLHSTRNDQVDDNKARVIGQIHLTREQSNNALKHNNDATYFQKFLHLGVTNGKAHYVFSKDSQWQYISREEDDEVGGIGNDRIIIKRDDNVSKTTALKANGFEGHDRIMGDNGNSVLKGESGNDFFEPGEGSDTVDGGSGTDTVSYKSLKAAVSIKTSTNNEKIKVSDSSKSWTDEVSNVEIIRTWGGSNHTLTNAESLSGKDLGYTLQTGATGTTNGSQYDDTLFISYSSNFNTDPANKTLNKTTLVDGKGGNDHLFIDGLAAHLEAGQTFKLTYSNTSQSSGFITKTTDNSNKKVLKFSNINKGVILTDTERNSQGLLTVKPLTEEQSNQANADWGDIDTDEIIGASIDNQNDGAAQNDALTGAPSAGLSNDNIGAPLQPGTSPQTAEVDSLNSVEQASTTLPAETVESTLASTVSMAHTAWEPGQERQQQPVWAQREFFIDPLA
ncbi:calcium-binding protein [Synechococcus sp. RS9916]|uniref:calcium-binding protein n=1 Tax=Synechococcus sp. RS9916 TaxID=221359 RepID=UPI0000E538D4|nr:calcium-binding protein [Synechococcus sp. RS9916]EAU74816.1 hypothetical protein RS9916_34952 [Synechococcus sp. RS9916]